MSAKVSRTKSCFVSMVNLLCVCGYTNDPVCQNGGGGRGFPRGDSQIVLGNCFCLHGTHTGCLPEEGPAYIPPV